MYSPLSIIVLDDIIIVIRIQFDFLFYKVSLPLCIQRMKKIKAWKFSVTENFVIYK